jgi:hypothetical protein
MVSARILCSYTTTKKNHQKLDLDLVPAAFWATFPIGIGKVQGERTDTNVTATVATHIMNSKQTYA